MSEENVINERTISGSFLPFFGGIFNNRTDSYSQRRMGRVFSYNLYHTCSAVYISCIKRRTQDC